LISNMEQRRSFDRRQRGLAAMHPQDPLCDMLVTPIEQFFVYDHGSIPAINPTKFRLTVRGDVLNPLRISLKDLQDRFPKRTIVTDPKYGGSQWWNTAAGIFQAGEKSEPETSSGSAVWGGVSLQKVLLAAGIKNSGRYAIFTALDLLDVKTKRTNYSSGISIETALRPEVILAYEMNSRPLTAEQGGPLRLIVPEDESLRGIKWLSEINLQAFPITSGLRTRFCNILE
jgi:sulfite oxidase